MASPPDRTRADTPVDLAAWMQAYGPGLRRYFSRRASPSEAEDLVQEVFLRLQAQAADQRSIDNVEGYLFTIAKHVLFKRYRRKAALQEGRHAPLTEDADAADDISPERILVGKQEIARAIDVLHKMPPRVRAAFAFHRFDKLSYAAIAVRMGVSKRTVRDLLQRAIDRLAQELEDYNGL